MENVFTLLDSEDKLEIKKAVKILIVKRVADELHEYDRWLIDGGDIERIVEEAISECIEEIKYEIKGQVKEKVMERFNQIQI